MAVVSSCSSSSNVGSRAQRQAVVVGVADANNNRVNNALTMVMVMVGEVDGDFISLALFRSSLERKDEYIWFRFLWALAETIDTFGKQTFDMSWGSFFILGCILHTSHFPWKCDMRLFIYRYSLWLYEDTGFESYFCRKDISIDTLIFEHRTESLNNEQHQRYIVDQNWTSSMSIFRMNKHIFINVVR